ncbi:glutamic acid-rich protein-like [Vespula squamosa]|uniref:Glutamic acid-rich protein-like n=1 Tax=Vespula squamosa TaxID=30214 RepID=A0ABD2BH17_VESSQ
MRTKTNLSHTLASSNKSIKIQNSLLNNVLMSSSPLSLLYLVLSFGLQVDSTSRGSSECSKTTCRFANRLTVSHSSRRRIASDLEISNERRVICRRTRWKRSGNALEEDVECELDCGPVRARVVASCGRRRRPAEEVPGLYIRRLTLEDPRSAKERSSGSRSRTPPRHICHPAGPYVSSSFFSGRGSSRSWQERIRKERPAYLTIVSLELPEAPVPLLESQGSARNYSDANRSDDKDDILDELLEKVSEVGKDRERESRGRKLDTFFGERRSRKSRVGSLECTKEVATLEECTRNILRARQKGEDEVPSREGGFRDVEDCICSEIPEKLRVDVRKKTEVTSASSRSPSPEVTHTIRIAMKYHGRAGRRKGEEKEEAVGKGRRSRGGNAKGIRERTTTSGPLGKGDEIVREEGCCTGANVALDFTLNCNSVRLTSRETSLKAETKDER